jgi:hypothetical protein
LLVVAVAVSGGSERDRVLDVSSGREVVAGGVVGESEVLDTPLKIPRDRDSLRASRDPSNESPSCVNPRILKSSDWRWTYLLALYPLRIVMTHTGVLDRGLGGRVVGAEPTGDKPNSSKSGVSIISIGSEKVVSSVLVAARDAVLPP